MSFKKYKDLIFGVVMLLFGGFYLYYTQQIQTRPKLVPSYASARIMPTLLGVLLAGLSVILIIQAVRKLRTAGGEAQKEKAGKGDLFSIVLTFAVIIGYMLFMPPLGFCLSTAIFLFLQMLILAPNDKRKYLQFAIIAVVFTAVVFVAFRVGLQMLLPRGVIESLLGF
jgi:hypothetical protein